MSFPNQDKSKNAWKFEDSKKVLLGCELCEEWKPSNEVSNYNGMLICMDCANDPSNLEYTYDEFGLD